MKELKTELDKWEQWEKRGGKEAFLRRETRRLHGDCAEAMRRASDGLERVKVEARASSNHRARARVHAVTSELETVKKLLIEEQDARQAAEKYNEELEARVAKLEQMNDLEIEGYRARAREAADAKRQKREREAELRDVEARAAEAAAQLAQEQAAAAARLEAAEAAARREALEQARLEAAEEAARAEQEHAAATEEMEAGIKAVRKEMADAISALAEASKQPPKGPKVYTDEEYDQLSYDAVKQARYRERKFFRWLISGREWRVENITGVLKEMGWVDLMFDTVEFQQLFMEKLRDLASILENVHYGINYGLWLHLNQKVPSRMVRAIRQAAAEKYDYDKDRYKRKPWYENPHDERDVVYVPFPAPAPTSYSEEIDDYSETYGLHSSTDGTCAVQCVNELVPHVITRDAHRIKPLDEIGDFEIVLQGDAARRGVKMFSQWVFKNPYIDSQSCNLLHLFALGVGVKDNKEGTIKLWGDQAKDLEAIHGKEWTLCLPIDNEDEDCPTETTHRVRTVLSATVDLCAERDLWGIIGGGCMCQGSEMQHRVPRERLSSIDPVMDWVGKCEEPDLELHFQLAHERVGDEPYPKPCPQCKKFSGTPTECAEQYAEEEEKFSRLEAAAAKSDKGRDAFNAACLTHAHTHRNVRWKRRGTPLANIPKNRVYLELLHSLSLNAAKLQIKHAAMKYYPDDIRDAAHRLFKDWGIPIDMRPPGKRSDPEKWPGGGTIRFLIEGGNGKCPGLAYVGAKLTHLLAENQMAQKAHREADAKAAKAAQQRLDANASAKEKTAAAAKAIGANLFAKPTSVKSKTSDALPLHVGAAATQKGAAAPKPTSAAAKPMEVETIPLASQSRLLTAEQVDAIKARYGPLLGQRVISTLLSYETFLRAWKVSKKRLPVPASQPAKNEFAVEWFNAWADWVEAIERVGDHAFKSWVPHRILHKGTRMIKEHGDLWARSTSALEMNQSEIGRTLDKVSSRRKKVDEGAGQTLRPVHVKVEPEDADVEEPTFAVDTSKMKVTSAMAQSAAKHFIAAQAYREDKENSIQMRETARLTLGEEGRSTKRRVLDKVKKTIAGVDEDADTMSNFITLMRDMRL